MLWNKVAAEFPLNVNFGSNQYIDLISKFKNIKIDFNIITLKRNEPRKKKLLIADMDSTIITSETLDDFAKLVGKGKEIKKITDDAMNGKIDFINSVTKRVEILSGINIKDKN